MLLKMTQFMFKEGRGIGTLAHKAPHKKGLTSNVGFNLMQFECINPSKKAVNHFWEAL